MKKKNENAANRQCSHLKVFFHCLLPANKIRSTPGFCQSCRVLDVQSVVARCCILTREQGISRLIDAIEALTEDVQHVYT
jgi:hypothetical protein